MQLKNGVAERLGWAYQEAQMLWLLGELVDGWENVADHNLLGGLAAYHVCRLLKLPKNLSELIVAYMLAHDWDKHLEREAVAIGQPFLVMGSAYLPFDVDKEIAQELRKPYPFDATGNDLRNFHSWDIIQFVLRYVDSCLGKEGGREAFVDWQIRIQQLRDRYAKGSDEENIDKKVGNALYSGVLLYNVIESITEYIEVWLWVHIVYLNPELRSQCSHPHDLVVLIKQLVEEDIA